MNTGFYSSGSRDYGSFNTTSSSSMMSSSDTFDSTNFNSLKLNVGSNNANIKSNCKQLEHYHKMVMHSDTLDIRNKIHTLQAKTNDTIAENYQLISKLCHLARAGKKQHRLEADQLATDFKEIIGKYHKDQETVATILKRNSFFRLKQYEEEEEKVDSLDSGVVSIQIEQQKKLESRTEMLLQHEREMKRIEADVMDIHEISENLLSLMNEQTQKVEYIADQIDETDATVTIGAQQINKAQEYATQRRRKLCIMLIVLLVILIILIAILVPVFKK